MTSWSLTYNFIREQKKQTVRDILGGLSANCACPGNTNTYDIIPREEWEVLEGCHEAIVSPEGWEKVQELIDRRPPIMEGTACPLL